MVVTLYYIRFAIRLKLFQFSSLTICSTYRSGQHLDLPLTDIVYSCKLVLTLIKNWFLDRLHLAYCSW